MFYEVQVILVKICITNNNSALLSSIRNFIVGVGNSVVNYAGESPVTNINDTERCKAHSSHLYFMVLHFIKPLEFHLKEKS